MTVSKARHRHQPKTNHHPQENNQARFLQLDKTKNENQPVQSQSGAKSERTPIGTERARQEKTCTSPLETHPKSSLQ